MSAQVVSFFFSSAGLYSELRRRQSAAIIEQVSATPYLHMSIPHHAVLYYVESQYSLILAIITVIFQLIILSDHRNYFLKINPSPYEKY